MNTKAESAYQELKDLLFGISNGPVSEASEGEITSLLIKCWESISGYDAESTTADKLSSREIEEVHWEHPVLSFAIERHGAFVKGSKTASLHTWSVDFERRQAFCDTSRKRRLQPFSPKLQVEPLVEKVVRAIVNNIHCDFVERRNNGSQHVRVGKLIPDEGGAKQTLIGRRKRFSKALEFALKKHHWRKVQGTLPNTFEKFSTDEVKLTVC